MRMTPEQYFKVRGEPSPPLFYEVAAKPVPKQKTVGEIKGYVVEVPEIPIQPANQVNYTGLIIGVVAVVAVVGLVVLGLAFLSRKG